MRERQRDRLLTFFQANLNRPIPLPEILAMMISQYGRVIHELRSEGHIIINEIVELTEHTRHTTFTYKGRRNDHRA